MIKITKTIPILLASSLLLSFTGCSNTNTAPDSTQSQEQAQTEVTLQTYDASMIGVGAFQRQIKEALGIDFVESVYSMEYQNQAQAIIDEYKSSATYTLEQPLMILNPFGTSRTGVYTYFKTEEPTNITYTISVDNESIPDYTATMYSNEEGTAVTEHEGQIIGLVQGYTNTVTFEVTDTTGNLIANTQYELTIPDFNTLDKLYFEVSEKGDTSKLTNGLFTISDYDLQDPEEYAHLLMTDNNGIIRAEIILDSIKQSPVVEFIDGNMVYACAANMIASVNRFGKVERLYDLGQYLYHHDMEYNPSNHSLAILADDTQRDTIEELVINLDLSTGEISMAADFEVLMKDIMDRATRPEQNMMYSSEFDWIHFNSVAFLNDTDILLSARELSSIIRVNNIYENPTIDSILADELLWENTAYADLVYKKGNEFSSHAGQHNLTVIHDDNLEEGQYYVTLFNNNWGSSPTWPEFDWSQLKGVNLDRNEVTEGNMGSAWYKYLVDDNAKTYTLVDSVELPYAGFVSNAIQMPNGNIQFNSGSSSMVFGECDSEGNALVQFHINPNGLVGAYRAMKFTYEGFWFN